MSEMYEFSYGDYMIIYVCLRIWKSNLPVNMIRPHHECLIQYVIFVSKGTFF
jgi:hypothetical protein